MSVEDPLILVAVTLSSHLDGPRIQEKTDILEINQNVPQLIIVNIIVNRYVIIFPGNTEGQRNIPCSNRKLREPMLVYGI